MKVIYPSEVKPIGSELGLSNIRGYGFQKKLGIAFNCEVGYNDFMQGYDNYKQYINKDISIHFNDKSITEGPLIQSLANKNLIDPVPIKGEEFQFNSINYIRYLIIKQSIQKSDNNLKQDEIGGALQGVIYERFFGKGEIGKKGLGLISYYYSNNRFIFGLYTDYIKYNYYEKNGRKDEFYNIKSVSLVNSMIKKSPKLGELLNNVGYEKKINKTNILEYVVYCIIFHGLQLYLVYNDNGPNMESTTLIVDKKNLNEYMKTGSYILDISTIIINFYNFVFKHIFEGTDYLDLVNKKRKTEQEREKLFYDMVEDSKGKNKVTFNVQTKNESPQFMSTKRTESDMNLYKKIEDEIGLNGEITKKKNKGKFNAISAKKQRFYGDKPLKLT